MPGTVFLARQEIEEEQSLQVDAQTMLTVVAQQQAELRGEQRQQPRGGGRTRIIRWVRKER